MTIAYRYLPSEHALTFASGISVRVTSLDVYRTPKTGKSRQDHGEGTYGIFVSRCQRAPGGACVWKSIPNGNRIPDIDYNSAPVFLTDEECEIVNKNVVVDPRRCNMENCVHWYDMSQYWTICLSRGIDKSLCDKWGTDAIVKISDLRLAAGVISRSLYRVGLATNRYLIRDITYRDRFVDLIDIARHKLSPPFIKPIEFSGENEVRMLFEKSPNARGVRHRDVVVPGLRPLCSIVDGCDGVDVPHAPIFPVECFLGRASIYPVRKRS